MQLRSAPDWVSGGRSDLQEVARPGRGLRGLLHAAVHHCAQADLGLGDVEFLVGLADGAARLGQQGDRLAGAFHGALAVRERADVAASAEAYVRLLAGLHADSIDLEALRRADNLLDLTDTWPATAEVAP